MKGDFSRWTFDPTKNYSRVLSLQGRVFLDADFNEGMELQLQHLRRLTADVLGPHAGVGTGFQIALIPPDPPKPLAKDFFISSGSYYVNGIRCDIPPLPPPAADRKADPGPKYSAQPYLLPSPLEVTANCIVYLDVWERFLTYIEDEDRTPTELQQTIREVALGGPDTAARSKVVWQVRLLDAKASGDEKFEEKIKQLKNDDKGWSTFIDLLHEAGTIRTAEPGSHTYGRLKARARKPKADDLPCATNPESRYRGPENQLYRVEIHKGGTFTQPAVGDPAASGAATSRPAASDLASGPSFKWSRENGSVISPIRTIEGPTVIVESLGRDDRLSLKQGDWVEVVDDKYVLENRAEPLLKVKSVDPETFTVELNAVPASNVGTVPGLHPILRRWEGTAPVSINADKDFDGYLPLEDGIEVHFSFGDYKTSDYWIIPARTATGDVEWPGPVNDPKEIPPHGIIHAYAPLALVTIGPAGGLSIGPDLRRTMTQLWK